jgi:hypothetical protein
VQRHVCATTVYALLPEGGLPVQRVEHCIPAYQARALRKWISPNPSLDKYLPRKWMADAHRPRRTGFNAAFAMEPQVPVCATVFYHYAIQAWRKLDLAPLPLELREQRDATPCGIRRESFRSAQQYQMIPPLPVEAGATWDR